MATLYISPTGSGKRDGSSLENAASIWSIDKMIQKAGAGGTVLMQADQGSYNLKDVLKIAHGGTEGNPVTIKGVDAAGNDMNVEIVGTRAAEYSPTGAVGADVFRLMDGADHLKFENMSFTNVQNAFRAAQDISDITISNMKADNVQRFFEDYHSVTTTATVSGLVIEDVTIHGFSKGAIRLQYDTNNVVIRNVYADSERQDGDNFAIGVHFGGTVHDVLVKNTSMLNATDTIHTYWNGDGFAAEANTYNLRYEDTYAAGNTDGGYDLKSQSTVLLRAVAEDNNRNFRIWGDGVTIIDSTSIDTNHRGGSGGQAHIHLSSGSTVTIVNSTIVDGSSLTAAFDLTEGNAKVILVGTDVILANALRLVKLAKGSSLTNADGSPVVVDAYEAIAVAAIEAAKVAAAGALASVPTTYAISPELASVTEGDTGTVGVLFTVTRGGNVSGAGTVDYAVSGSGEHAADAADFKGGVLPSGTVSFAAGETTKTIRIEVQSDKVVEANEAFQVKLAAEKATIVTGTAEVLILNDDVKAKVFTVLDKAHAVDLSSSLNQVFTGMAGHNSYYVDVAAGSGKDSITSFDKSDVLLTTKALYDNNKDGIIKFGAGATLAVDGPKSKDTITFQSGVDDLRALGTTKAGLYVYAEADVRPKGAVEGKLSDDVLSGNLKKATTFFYDTALDIDQGADTIVKFGAKDLLVTTSQIAATDNKITVDQFGRFALPGGTGGADDTYVAGEGGSVAIFNTSGKAINTLEYDGTVHHNGVDYYVYSQLNSAMGVHDLLL